MPGPAGLDRHETTRDLAIFGRQKIIAEIISIIQSTIKGFRNKVNVMQLIDRLRSTVKRFVLFPPELDSTRPTPVVADA